MINSRCTSRPSLSIGLDRSINALGSGWRGGNGTGTARSLRGVEAEATVGNVMLGLRMDVFINVNRDGYTDVHSVTLGSFTFQPNMTSNRHLRLGICLGVFGFHKSVCGARYWSFGELTSHARQVPH